MQLKRFVGFSLHVVSISLIIWKGSLTSKRIRFICLQIKLEKHFVTFSILLKVCFSFTERKLQKTLRKYYNFLKKFHFREISTSSLDNFVQFSLTNWFTWQTVSSRIIAYKAKKKSFPLTYFPRKKKSFLFRSVRQLCVIFSVVSLQ